jgi:hypothetical protein
MEAPMPVPTLGVPVPGLVDAATDAVSVGRPITHTFCGGMDELYVLNSVKGGQYKLTINGTGIGFNVTLTVGINGQTFGTVRRRPLYFRFPIVLGFGLLLCLCYTLRTTRLSELCVNTFKVMINARSSDPTPHLSAFLIPVLHACYANMLPKAVVVGSPHSNGTVPVVPVQGGPAELKLGAGVSALKISSLSHPHQCVQLYTIAVASASTREEQRSSVEYAV